jgi:ribosome maturation protein SDO1
MSKKIILSLLLATILAIVQSAKVPVTLFNSTEHPYARCLDGSTAGYYAQQAPNPADKTKFVIYLNGGGECDKEGPCKAQLTGSLGSSKYFASEVDANGWYFASDYCTYNPIFCGWNHVYNPYCTQDLHAGQVKEASDKTWGMYFAGHHVMEAMLDEMDKAPFNMKDATEIILSGASAGGIGVWMNVDYIARRYPKAKVTALTIAGFYFYATYYDGANATAPSGMGDFRESAFPVTYDLYEAYVDQSCKLAYEKKGMHPGACMLANNSFPYIEVDSFAIQALTDK